MPKTINLPQIIHMTATSKIQQWLNSTNPLTDKLEKTTGHAAIELLFQGWTKPGWWERFVLNIWDKEVFLREIMMRSNSCPYWYARTIIPIDTYNLEPEFFKRLERESIKNLIYHESRVDRTNLYSYPVGRSNTEFYWIHKYLPDCLADILWVRFAEYNFKRKENFYLLEILLPEIENLE